MRETVGFLNMSLFETGRVCLKTAGREAGKLCVVVNKVDGDHVLVTGPRVLSGIRRRKCNTDHLEPLQLKLTLKADAADSDVLDLLKKDADELLKKLDLKVPTAEEIKKAEELRKQKRSEAEKRQQEAAKKKEAEKPKEPAAKQEEKTEEKKQKTEVDKSQLPSVKEEPKHTEKKESEVKKEAVSEKPKKAAKPKTEKKKE